MMTENQRAREPDASSERTRRCGACGETKPDTAALFYTLLGNTTARCRACGKGGARPGTGGARRGTGGARQGAGRKATALAGESGHLVARVKIGDRAPIELPAGAMMCATCQRVLPVARFKAPVRLLTKGKKVRAGWAPLPYCDSCRRRHRKRHLQGSPMEKGEGRPAGPAEPKSEAVAWQDGPSSSPPGGTATASRKCPENLNMIDESGGNHHQSSPTRPPNLPALAAALEPIIGPWPATAEEQWQAFSGVSDQVENENVGIYPGRQKAVMPIVRKGKVQVLDAPDYIDRNLIHALPSPKLSEHLGSAAIIRSVPVEASPALGRAWYVIVTVPGLGRRLRLWDSTDWPYMEKRTAADWEALVPWWNAGVDAGWSTFYPMNDTDLSHFFGDAPADVPPSVLARLKRTPALTAWLNKSAPVKETTATKSPPATTPPPETAP